MPYLKFLCLSSLSACLTATLSIGVTLDACAEKSTPLTRARDHNMEALRLKSMGEPEAALVEVNTAIKAGIGSAGYACRAEVLLELQDYKNALTDARLFAKLQPGDPNSHFILGRVLDEMKADSECLKEYSEAVRMQPANNSYRKCRARVFERRGQFKEAIDDMNVELAGTEKQNQPKIYERRAACYAALHDYKKAVADYSVAIERLHEPSKDLRLRANAYEKLGNHAAAQKDLNQAKELEEDFQPPASL